MLQRKGGHGKSTFVGTAINRTPDTETGNNANEGIQLRIIAKWLTSSSCWCWHLYFQSIVP